MRISVIFISFYFLLGCTPKVLVSLNKHDLPEKKVGDNSTFITFESDSVGIANAIELGEVTIKDAGFAMNCDFETVKKLAVDKCKEIGANGMVIKEHKYPDFASTCHRIKVTALLLDDPRKYEKIIEWSENRKLEIKDFKGGLENRPFKASTFSSVTYSASTKPIKNLVTLNAQTIFDTEMSYFNIDSASVFTLSHEQLHFDITELYSRIFIKRIGEEIADYNDFLGKHHSIINAVMKECSIKQDEYDTEVYADFSKQSKWNNWVKDSLNELSTYKKKKIDFPMRKK